MLVQGYSLITLKAVDEEQRIIEGIASTPAIDRDGDEMDPAGAKYVLPMPLLWMHKQDEPLGNVLAVKATSAGLFIRAQILPKNVSARIDEAWALIKSGVVRGLSIRARLLKHTRNATGGLKGSEWEWLETSAVTIPANAAASITLVKSLDAAALQGTAAPVRRTTTLPAVAGAHATGTAMNISEQLASVNAQMTEKTDVLNPLVQKSIDGETLTAEELTERETLTSQVSELTKQRDTLKALEQAMGGAAQPITVKAVEIIPKPKVEVVQLEKGIRFARVAMAIAAGKGSISDTIEYAKRWKGQTPEVFEYVKSMVTKAIEGTSVVGSPAWGGELVYQNNIAGELIELLRPATIIGRINGFRAGVFNTRMAIQTAGSTVNWVGEGAEKPVTELAFDTVTLPYHKIAGIVVLTEELVRLSTPSAEATVRNDLVAQIARFMDAQFITPSVSAGANNPASITNGVSSPAASGTDADAFYLDMNTALATFDNVENSENLTIVMTPALARGISTLRNAMGGFEFPALTARGGSLMGYPVIVSGSVPSGTIVILNPGDILLADDGRVSLDASNQATLNMGGGGDSAFNLWQQNCIAIRAERWITYKKVRDESVAVIDTASYGPTGS